MSAYDELLERAREAAEQFRSTAKEFIPKMYKALRNENRNISPEDARDRIEKDCVGIWSRRTILDALPDEAKNQEKQKAGRSRQKEENSAAFSAATAPHKQKVMITSTQGTIERNEEQEALNNFESKNANNLDERYRPYPRSTFLEEETKIKKREAADKQECIGCQELQIKVRDYEEALAHVPFLTADQIDKSTLKYQIPKERHHILEEAMRRCSRLYQVTFDNTGTLVSAEPDIS